MARSRPRRTLPERLTDRVQRLLRGVEGLRNALAKERVAHADTQTLWRRQHDDLVEQNKELVRGNRELLTSYQFRLDAHQKEIGEKNALKETLRGDIIALQRQLSTATNLPAAHSQIAGRVVPLKYWADTELLALLHDLENSALLPEVHGLDVVGLPVTAARPFPWVLLTQVTQEVGERKLTVRPHTSIAVAG